MVNYQTYDVAVMNYPLLESLPENKMEERLFADAVPDQHEVPIYIHIPFCTSLCDFCIYNRMPGEENSQIVERYVKALIQEIRQYAARDYVKQLKIGSVFIGGGTPTVLNEGQLTLLLHTLREYFALEGCEITVECKADSAGEPKLKRLKELGVTRVSTGIQTFQDDLRKKLHIKNNSKDVCRWLELVDRIGFLGISADMIYGLPNMGEKQTLQDIATAAGLPVNHISVYKLTSFAYTKLYQDAKIGKYQFHSARELEDIFYRIHETLYRMGFQIQSTQEYGREGSRVKFWDLTYDGYGDNLSFGLSSFGYVGGHCYQNEERFMNYLEKAENERLPVALLSPVITEVQRMERAMIMGFRRGILDRELFRREFGKEVEEVFGKILKRQIEDGYVTQFSGGYRLTPSGYFHQGTISVDYMISIFEKVSPLKKKMCIGSHRMP